MLLDVAPIDDSDKKKFGKLKKSDSERLVKLVFDKDALVKGEANESDNESDAEDN